MIGTNFDHVRRFFLDPSQEARDNRLIAKIACVTVKVFCAINMVYSAISPVYGSNIIYAGLSCLIDVETLFVAQNLEDMLSGNASLIINSSMPSVFVNALFKNTLILGPVCKGVVVDVLDRWARA